MPDIDAAKAEISAAVHAGFGRVQAALRANLPAAEKLAALDEAAASARAEIEATVMELCPNRRMRRTMAVAVRGQLRRLDDLAARGRAAVRDEAAVADVWGEALA